MTKQVAVFVSGTIFCAAAASAASFVIAPIEGAAPLNVLISLAALGLVAEALCVRSTGTARISIAAIPFLAAALISPPWLAVVVITAASAVSQLIRRRKLIRGLFNIAQTALAVSIAIIVYRELGGTSLVALNHLPLV